MLCLNTSLTVFLSGLSRKGVPESELYSAASAVVTAEFLKLVMCFLLLALTDNGKKELLEKPLEKSLEFKPKLKPFLELLFVPIELKRGF